jgi:hypothetical protein
MDCNPDGIFFNMELEIWMDIKDYEGLYQVSSFGFVKSLIPWRGANERILKPFLNNDGYLTVKLQKLGVKRTLKVHKLVAMTFHGHVPNGHNLVIDHIDNNPLNNKAYNLQIITNRENTSKDKKGGTSEYVGVSFKKTKNKYEASIVFKKRLISLGCFKIETDAHYAYQKALKECNDGLDLNLLYPKRINSSIYKGVSFVKNRNEWRVKYNNVSIGSFKTEEEANKSYKKADEEYKNGLNIKEIYNKKTSQYKWVSWDKSRNKWEVKYKKKFIGRYNTEIEAHEAVQKQIA